MNQLTFSSSFYLNICIKICILEQIIATVMWIWISLIHNKRSMLRFQTITAAPTEGGLPVARGGGGYSREIWIGVCREGLWTLTLFKDKESENWYPF